MKRKKLYIAILLLAGVLTSCKVGKSYVRPDLHLPDGKIFMLIPLSAALLTVPWSIIRIC